MGLEIADLLLKSIFTDRSPFFLYQYNGIVNNYRQNDMLLPGSWQFKN